ncbi:Lar family restriction alleviation protein [bacterium]|nr:Lar family restriction alleviation protein [bacterium]
MKDKIELKSCPHCGGEATLASPDQWSYLSCIVFCPSCLAKGPQGDDNENAIACWMFRSGTQYPAAVDAVAKACPYCASEEIVEGDNGLGNEPGHEGTLFFTACPHCLARGPHVREKDKTVEAWNKRMDEI